MVKINIKLPRHHYDLLVEEKFQNGITGIYGNSGSGKTSLLKCIAGLEKPTEGHISIHDRVLFDSSKNINLPVERRNIGYVFQEGRLFPHMSVEQNLRYGMKLEAPSDLDFDEVIELLNLSHLLKSYPSQISGGEQQRTALARTLLSFPDILLLDEPFSAVDVRLRSQILPFILKIQQVVQIPVFIVSHDLPDILHLTQNILLLQEGKCFGHGNYYALLADTKYSKILGGLSIINTVDMRVAEIQEEQGLVLLQHHDQVKVIVKCRTPQTCISHNQSIRIVIHADDIALSSNPIQNITIQNQLEGQVLEIVQQDSAQLCIVDVGFKLAVEITSDSLHRMGIEKGSKVWCLFKSMAVDVVV